MCGTEQGDYFESRLFNVMARLLTGQSGF